MKRTLIGLVTGLNKEETYLTVNQGYTSALVRCGALPVVLPLTDDPALLSDMIDQMDGFVFTGGADIDPLHFGEQTSPACGVIEPLRDAMELPLARLLAARTDKPVLGICRGMQVLNVALGGSLYQDLSTEYPGQLIAHRQKHPDRFTAHEVAVSDASLLRTIVGAQSVRVNTLHHQAVRELGKGIAATACAPDGVTEAIELTGHPFFLGVQWHPERLWQNDEVSLTIFQAFAEACRIRS